MFLGYKVVWIFVACGRFVVVVAVLAMAFRIYRISEAWYAIWGWSALIWLQWISCDDQH
jgi:hypothetical protein